MRQVRENIVAAKGNYSVYTAGVSILGANGKLLPKPGQVVVYDPDTLISLGAGITKDTNPRIVIGVAEDLNGDGVSDVIRKSFGDIVHGCNITNATGKGPTCGTHEVVDLLFDCANCGEGYSVHVTVEDDQTQNQYPYNRPALYSATGTVPCNDCEDCDTAADTTALACAIEDALNATVPTDPTKYSFYHKASPPEMPFTAVRLYNNSYLYCLSPVTLTACDNCINVAGLKSITVTVGEGDPVVTAFTNNTNPDNSSYTLLGQLQGIVDQINDALDGNGHAVLVEGIGDCCPYQLEINTCATVVLTDVADATVDPCDSTNPLDAVTFAKTCKNCGATTETKTFTAGIRIISKAIKLNCRADGYPANPPISYLGRRINIHGSGFGSTYTRKVQSMTWPQNMGYTWQYRDYASDNGGHGRGHNPYNRAYGPLNLPGDQDRANSPSVACGTSYCSYILGHQLPGLPTGVSEPVRNARGRTVILIPSKDEVTKASFEAIINPYLMSGSCLSLEEITCEGGGDVEVV